MAEYISQFEFDSPPKELTYHDGETLKLSEEFRFYHNKMKFRKELNKLQFLVRDYLKNPLQAAGIRDTYLKLEYTDKYLMVIFTDPEVIKNTNQIIEKYDNKDLLANCFLIDSTQDYLILLTKNQVGLKAGTERLHDILDQVLDEYFKRKDFDKFIQIRPFTLIDCAKEE